MAFVLTPDGWSEEAAPAGMPVRTGPAFPSKQMNEQRPTHVGETPGYTPFKGPFHGRVTFNTKYSRVLPTALRPGFTELRIIGSQQIVKAGGTFAAIIVEMINGGAGVTVEIRTGAAQTLVATLVASDLAKGLRPNDRLVQTITDANSVWARVVGAPKAIKLLVLAYNSW